MAMVCPQCRTPQEQRLECPGCGVRLVFEDGLTHMGNDASPGWQNTPWGRIAIGLVLSQGIFHGLRHLTVAGLLASQLVDQNQLWSTLPGILLLQALQVVSLFAGAMLAGAGQKQGAA